MRNTSRLAALAAGSSLVVTGLVASPAGAVDTDPAKMAVSWLVANGVNTSPNLGLAGDTALAMAEIDQAGYAAQIGDIWTYVQTKLTPSTPGPAVAKAALVAQAANANAAAVVAQLEAKVDDATGKVADTTNWDGVVAQSLTAWALTKANSPEAAKATDYLAAQQCASSGFPEKLDDGACAAGTSVDATSFAVLALKQAGRTAEVTAATTFLKGEQAVDGSWGAYGTPNSNSTGLAAWALGASPESTKAATWMRGLQLADAPGCDVFKGVGVPDPQGGVVWSADDRKAAATDGITSGSITGLKYATPQAAPALRWAAPAAGALSLTAPTAFVKAGSAVSFSASNVAVNDAFCVSGVGSPVAGLGKAGATQISLQMPAGTANRSVRLADTQGRSTTKVVKVLGARKFAIQRSATSIKRGKPVNITIGGFAPGEQVRLFYKGALVRNAKAGTAGYYRTRLYVGQQTGVQSIKVWGQFPATRNGATTIRVIR